MTGRLSLLLIGIGCIGGDIFWKLHKSDKYDITVLARNPKQIEALKKFGNVKTIQASLQDLEILTKSVKEHDIIINSASSDDVPAAKALIAGLDVALGATKKTFLQISGAGVYAYKFNTAKGPEHVYDDDDYEDINTISPESPHRDVDLLFLEASREKKANIAILIPSTIYGGVSSLFKAISIQIPIKVEKAIKDGYYTTGTKYQPFGQIHVEDNTRGTILILESILEGRVSVEVNPYFNLVQKEFFTWTQIAHRAVKTFVRLGVWDKENLKVEGDWDFYGIYLSKATRLQKLGWYEHFGTQQDLNDGVDFEVETILREKGLVKNGVETGSKVLITGASGWVGSAVTMSFLRHPALFNVRLALRERQQFDEWLAEYPWFASRLEYAPLTSLTEADAFKDAVKDIAYIAHTASPVGPQADRRGSLLDPAIKGTVSILEAAAKESSVKAIAFTSSLLAFVNFLKPRGPNDPAYDETNYNGTTYEEALVLPTEGLGPMLAYSASKGLADEAAFNFVKTEKPKWQLTANSVAPAWVSGPTERPNTTKPTDIRTTALRSYVQLIKSDKVVPLPLSHFTDIRDAARVHVEAVLSPKAAGKRYLVIGGRASHEEAAEFLPKAFPEHADKFAKGRFEGYGPYFNVDNTPATEDFDFKYTSWEKSMTDWAQQVFELSKA